MENKQIEEMVIALTESQHEFDKAWHECLHNGGKQPERENVFYANYLIENKGYRKASKVAEEIFAEIETVLDTFDGSWANTVINTQYLISELKKKYTESEMDNG